jgi:cysteine synthase A
MGERYLDTIYNTNWVEGIYGSDTLNPTASVEALSVAA